MLLHRNDERVERRRTRLRDLTARLLQRWHGHSPAEPAANHEPSADRALLLVDVQNDLISGAAAVSGAARILPVLNRYLDLFAERKLPVYLARDWHPPDTVHLSNLGLALPPHCVRGTSGAAFPDELRIPVGAVVISKGTRPGERGYSAFSGHHPGPVALGKCLETRGVRIVYVAGLGAGVLATVLDGKQLGFEIVLLADAVRGFDGTSVRLRRAIEDMCRAGARVEQFEDVVHDVGSVSTTPNGASSPP